VARPKGRGGGGENIDNLAFLSKNLSGETEFWILKNVSFWSTSRDDWGLILVYGNFALVPKSYCPQLDTGKHWARRRPDFHRLRVRSSQCHTGICYVTGLRVAVFWCTGSANLWDFFFPMPGSRDAPDIRPDNPAFFGIRPNTRLPCRISGTAEYRISGYFNETAAIVTVLWCHGWGWANNLDIISFSLWLGRQFSF
jgi:hypothetical protein